MVRWRTCLPQAGQDDKGLLPSLRGRDDRSNLLMWSEIIQIAMSDECKKQIIEARDKK